VVLDEPEHVAQAQAHALERVDDARVGLDQAVDLLAAADDDRGEDLVLVREVVVERARGDAGLGGHVGHLGLVEAEASEHSLGGDEDRLAVGRAGLAPHGLADARLLRGATFRGLRGCPWHVGGSLR
jgi:hypothetical protein